MSNPTPAVLRLTAFASEASGGNPAGVVLDASALSEPEMQRIAADIGYAETAFITRPATPAAPSRVGIRYFTPTAEVPFCGHATIATAVALATRDDLDELIFETQIGEVRIDIQQTDAGTLASFTSVEPHVDPIDETVLARLLSLLRTKAPADAPTSADPATTLSADPATTVTTADLHPSYPPRLAFAGNTHPVIVLADRILFDGFTFDPDAMRSLMDEQGWAGTVTILHVINPAEFEARNLFPVGTMDEDPATGSAAASVGAYLRELGLVGVPQRISIRQGRHVGRPSLLVVDIAEQGGIVVSGTATVI